MLKSSFVMFLEAYCQTKTISAKNNILPPYNLHDWGSLGILWVFFFGVKL